jgi:chromosome segregation and condensation protein ScpB
MRGARLRRRLTLPALARQIGMSIGMLSMLERGERNPRADSRAKIEAALGMAHQIARVDPAAVPEAAGGAVAAIGACLAVLREAKIADLALAADVSVEEAREALRVLSARLAPLGMRVVDDAATALLQPAHEVAHVPAVLTAPRPRPALTDLQQSVLMMAIYCQGITSEEVSDLRGVNSWSVLDSLRVKGYLAMGRDSFIYQPTRLVLERLGCDTFEELREAAAMAISPELLASLPARPRPDSLEPESNTAQA